MQVFIFTLGTIALLMVVMAIGVIFSGRRLRGSCGGVGGEDCVCDENGRPILQQPDCDDDIHTCEKDPSTCAFATKACELRHARARGGALSGGLFGVTGVDVVDYG
ncbi:MAG: hypothetical protein CL930_03800 [Deltaproteobacteria bacterium]|nr:hypothetical protein [Deltaproteobacteria bacterium]|tara:strand:+ start:145 stop:462 length:318 start_codon:yes stop_codon:yes gene_type:complete